MINIGSNNGFLPDKLQAIIRTITYLLLIGPSATNSDEI